MIRMKTMTKKHKLTIAALVVLLLAGAGIYQFRTAAPEERVEPAHPAVNGSQTLTFAPGSPQLSYLKIEAAPLLPVPLLEPLNGRLAYDDNVTARVFVPVTGRVLKVVAQAGDTVKAGQPLLLLDVPDYADLRRAESDQETKRSAFERAKTLYEGEVMARKDLEAAANDLKAAEAETDRARARMRNLTPVAGEAGFALRAPLAGIVTERQANPGTEVRPDAAQPLFVVSDPKHLWAMAELTEKDLGKVKVGQKVDISVDAYPDHPFLGVVEAVGDVLDPQSRRVPVRCRVDNADRLLKPEMFARIIPESPDLRLPRIPNTALVTEGLHTYLFVENAPGSIERRRIKLAFRGHEHSYVAEGLKPDERVVTAGALLLNAELAGN